MSAPPRDLRAPRMPYADAILADLDGPDVLWQRHLHWGYWPDPEAALGTYPDYADAAERMTQRIVAAAGIRDGMRILDCGCGIGGAIATLNERYRDLRLVGLNVDERQLDVARARLAPRAGNTIELVAGDACELPFADSSFDAVLAIECIFHFPSRWRFFREVRRVLDRGGTLALSDFVPFTATLPLLLPLNWSIPFFGDHNALALNCGAYRALGRLTGLPLRRNEDVTRNTLPSYEALDRWLGGISPATARQGRIFARVSRARLLRYRILSFAVRGTARDL